jgi:3-hydroxybutyryl-CoA dehydrogenase
MKIKEVAVLGAGSMGNGIAQVTAQAGYPVVLYDIDPGSLERGLANIRKMLVTAVQKGKTDQAAADATLARITPVTDLARVASAQLVIEAVPENLDLKTTVFRQADILCPPETIIASNTSSLPIASLAAATGRPDKVLGMHFMNPVPLMKGVELIRSRMTADEPFDLCAQFITSLGKTPVEAVDYAGFVVSRVLDVMLNEAVFAVMDGNKPEEIDKAMKVCTNFPMGPLELIDLAGADILLNVMEIMEQEFGDKYRPAPLLRQMVRAGHTGRKAGKGFYDYTGK